MSFHFSGNNIFTWVYINIMIYIYNCICIYIYMCVCDDDNMYVCMCVCARFQVVNWSVLSVILTPSHFFVFLQGPWPRKTHVDAASESKVLIFRGLWVPQAGDIPLETSPLRSPGSNSFFGYVFLICAHHLALENPRLDDL